MEYFDFIRPMVERPNSLPGPTGLSAPLLDLRRRIHWLKWIVPAALFLFVIVYEIGPSQWIHDGFGNSLHLAAEIILYGTVGPVLAFTVLDFLGRWLDERETSELQARILARRREEVKIHHQLSDDTLQMLFATTVLLASLEADHPELPPEAIARLREAQSALDRAIQQIHRHLLDGPPHD